VWLCLCMDTPIGIACYGMRLTCQEQQEGWHACITATNLDSFLYADVNLPLPPPSCSSATSKESRSDKLRKDIDFVEHTWPIDKLHEYYGSTPTGGLTSAQMLQNRQKYGWNRLTPPVFTPW
jgi:hypothetical protein